MKYVCQVVCSKKLTFFLTFCSIYDIMLSEVIKMTDSTKVTTAVRLRQIMEEQGLKQIDIVKKCQPYSEKYKVKIGRNDISQYVAGKVEPGQSKLFILAKALRVSEAWLMGYTVPKEPVYDSDDINIELYGIKPIVLKRFPMLGEIACGEPIYASEGYETFVEASASINADFCLTAKGDSMINARIFDGDIVFIRQQPDVENGEIAAVIIDNDVTLKRVYKYKDRIELRPENPMHKVQDYEGEKLNEIKILGKAIAFQSYVR